MPVPNGTYTLGDTIDIRVSVTLNGFDDTTGGGDPHSPGHIQTHSLVKLETGETDRFAKFVSAETHHIYYRYTVQPGDSSDDLDYHSEKALYWAIRHGPLIHDVFDGNTAPLTCVLPPPMGPGSLSNRSDIKVDGIVPRIVSVATPSGTGVYSTSSGINVTVSFDDMVYINGTGGIPLIALDEGANARNATYVSGNRTQTLSFWYAAQGSAGGLDYVDNKALALNGSTIRDVNGNPADLTIRDPGTGGRFGDSGVARILDTSMPFVRFVSSPDPGGTYGTGRIVNITAVLDRPVTLYGGEPRLELSTTPTRYAAYAGGNGTDRLYFLYTVMPGDGAARLDYASTGALSLPEGGYASYGDGGGTVTGLQPLLPPGAPGSLGGSDPIAVVGGTLPILRPNGTAIDDFRVSGSAYTAMRSAYDVDAFEVGGGTYALVLGRGENAVQLIRILDNGTLSAAGTIRDSACSSTTLCQPEDVVAFEINGSAHALVSGGNINLLSVGPGGTLLRNDTAAQGSSSPGGTFDKLDGAAGAAVFETANGTYAVVAARNVDGLQLVNILPNGTLSRNGSASNGVGGFLLGRAGSVDILGPGDGDATRGGGAPRALVSSYGDNTVQLVSIHPNGTLSLNGSATNGTRGFALAGVSVVDVFGTGGGDGGSRTHAVATSSLDDAVQLIRIHPNGTLVAAGSAFNGTGGFDALDHPQDVAVFGMGGWTYALVASYSSDGIQLVRIDTDDGGALAAAGSAKDEIDGFKALNNADGVAVFDVGNRTYALVASQGDHGVQMVRLSPASPAGVSSPAGAGPHLAGATINITVAFDERVVLQDPLYCTYRIEDPILADHCVNSS